VFGVACLALLILLEKNKHVKGRGENPLRKQFGFSYYFNERRGGQWVVIILAEQGTISGFNPMKGLT